MKAPRSPDPVRDESAYWFARRRERDFSAEEQARFAAWLDAHERHRQEYELLDGLWTAADLIPAARLRQLCEEKRPSSRRRFVQLAAAATVAGVALGLGWLLYPSGDYRETLQTRVGERQEVTLPDGSVVQLNSRTRLEIHYREGRRSVELQTGEALFSVSRDPARPFVIDAGPGQVTVTGTRFDVLHEGGEVRVAVESGTVQVAGKAADQPVILTAGKGTRVDGQGRVAPARDVNLQAIVSWRDGKLVFDNATLAEVAAQVSRYREQPLRVDPSLANLRFSSVFSSDDTDTLLSALPRLLPVQVRTLPDGSSEIIPL
ncbi:FecR family protein [Zestomonas carbonaria]|uniref:Protein FecR n=1 Tax=Zestomonas carbonaria TaxID=2762745 RepID=A0A7U7ESD8_9GAMM|nr:FecR family protein [Pseudomonas carbonaria]CAD5109963.1 Protein FecR [Pseudomonas carbonaria]